MHRYLRLALWLGLIGVAVNVSFIGRVWAQTVEYRFSDPGLLKPTRVAIVFGAFATAQGEPSEVLRRRVDGAIELYNKGIVQRILLSGDNGSTDYDEVGAMRRYALRQGIPEPVLALDYAGFSTYETCARARLVFEVREAILVTQRYHAARAAYTCRALGIEAQAYALPDTGVFTSATIRSWVIREALATIKAAGQIHITRPAPTFLGALEGPL
jgi:vancomycin permeability regulator SanA